MTEWVKCTGAAATKTPCNRKETCLRYTQEALPRHQAWLIECVSIPDVNKCKFFIGETK